MRQAQVVVVIEDRGDDVDGCIDVERPLRLFRPFLVDRGATGNVTLDDERAATCIAACASLKKRKTQEFFFSIS